MRQTDKEYAQALFLLASEESCVESTLADLRLIREVLSGEGEYIDFLASPAIPLRERLAAIDEAFSGGAGDYTVYFLKLLCEKGRIRSLFDAIDEFEALYKELSGRSCAVVTSAYELTEEQKASLVTKLEKTLKKGIDLIYVLDSSLIGGLKIELDGKVYDGTIKSRLRDVKDVMLDDATGRDQ